MFNNYQNPYQYMNSNGYGLNTNYQNNQQRYQQVGVKGHTVSSIEEVRSAFIDMDGSTTIFPCPANNCIYTKSIDLNGQPVFKVYQLVDNANIAPKYADIQMVQNLNDRLVQIENFLKQKEGTQNDKPATNV